MLRHLSVKNLSLLEDVSLELGSGLHVLTGETGSGKSIVLDALSLVLGRRADPGLIREGASRLTVAARFENVPPRARAVAEELGVWSGDDEGLLIRREVEAAGKSRAFINDRPVHLPALTRLAEELVFFHGQHEQQWLQKPAAQRDFLDTFGKLEALRREVADRHAEWRATVEERDALTLSDQERAQRIDLYRHQEQELKAAGVRVGEDAEWQVLLPQLKNAEKLKALSAQVLDALQRQDGAAVETTGRAHALVRQLIETGAPLGETAELLSQALVQLEEAVGRLETFAEGVQEDPARLEDVLGRMDLLARLKKKYGPTLNEVVATADRVRAELARLENLEDQRRDISERVERAARALADRAAELSQARRAAAKKLTAALQKELREVGLPDAHLSMEVLPLESGVGAAGADLVQFQFAPNPGEGRRPLADIASGGELSRVMLALESVLAKTDGVPVLVFDEIDSGVGGTLGAVLGKKLAALGGAHQVLCVTHLATIAACGDRHFVVDKRILKDRTRTEVREVSKEERVQEIARLFGGTGTGSDAAIGLRHARELLASSMR